ncbi:MAG TPA: hypothetical protein VN958_12740, partial [Chitinophagaceae bacterium]|nr:hypothetical protein [Chitinophagaceae bacterium]
MASKLTETIKDLITIASPVILISGIIYKYFYYADFNLNVFNYLDVSEYLFAFFNISYIAWLILAFLFFISQKNSLGEELRIESKYLLALIILILIVIFY